MRKFKNIITRLSELRSLMQSVIASSLFILGLLGVAVIIFEVGFSLSAQVKASIRFFYVILIEIFFVLLLFRFLLTVSENRSRKIYASELILILLTGLLFINRNFLEDWLSLNIPIPGFLDHIFITYFIITVVSGVEISRGLLSISNLNVSPAVLFVASFLIIILGGAGLLLLPNSSNEGLKIVDALFVSTSAVCVTGLTTINVSHDLTGVGKFFLLMLFQVGGLGIMTFTSFFAYFFAGGYSFENRLVLKDLVNTDTIGEIFKTIIKIIFITFSIELLGALTIYLFTADVFTSDAARFRFSVFHAVSAFCQAGFSTLPEGFYDASIRSNYSLHFTAAVLILLGSLGFPIVFNYYTLSKYRIRLLLARILKRKPPPYHSHIINVNTKIILTTTALLTLFGFGAFYIAEYDNALKDLPLHGKIVTAFFGSVTPRSGGLNTIDMGSITPALALIYLLLMWIGGSPSSTAGGIKTSTFAVAVLNIINIAKARERIEVFGREIPTEAVKRSYAVITLSLLFMGFGVFLVTIFEPQLNLTEVAFECFSAYGTVGLSMGITPELSTASKYVIIVLMFVGRVSVLTFVFMFVRKRKFHRYRLPADNIIIT